MQIHATKISKKSVKRLDRTTIEIIHAIDRLLLKSHRKGLATVSNILDDTKERIALWAAYDDYNETGAEKLLAQLTLENSLVIALEFMAKWACLGDQRIKEDMFETLKPLTGKPGGHRILK